MPNYLKAKGKGSFKNLFMKSKVFWRNSKYWKMRGPNSKQIIKAHSLMTIVWNQQKILISQSVPDDFVWIKLDQAIAIVDIFDCVKLHTNRFQKQIWMSPLFYTKVKLTIVWLNSFILFPTHKHSQNRYTFYQIETNPRYSVTYFWCGNIYHQCYNSFGSFQKFWNPE